MSKALELAKFGRESAPTGLVVGDSDAQTLSSKTFSDGPVFSAGAVNAIPYLNASKVFSTLNTFVFDGTNLGLGTATPGAKFHNTGQSYLIGRVYTEGAFASYGGQFWTTSAAVPMILGINEQEKARIHTNGNFGVGIQAPSAIIHTQSSGLGDGGGIKLGNSGSGGGTFAIWPTATINGEGADKLIFSGSGGNLVTITGAGKVGIGTTIPQLQLDLGSATSNRGISWGGTSGNYVNIWTTYGGADLNIGTNVKPLGNNTGYYSSYADAGTARNIIRLNAFTGNGIQFFTDTQSSVAVDTGVTPSERMRITPAGRVGVGLGTPVTLLHINTAGTARGLTIDNNYSGGAGGTTGMSVANATNDLITLRAGYGDNPETTTNNGMKWGIHFSGNNGDTWPFNGKSAGIYAVSEEAANAGYNRKVGLSFWTSSMDTDYAERFRIDNNGRVIINPNQTTTYAGMLDIYGGGSGALGAIRIGDGTYSGGHINYWDIGRDNTTSGDFTFALNASEKMRIKANGNLAIGTTANTAQKLNVNGAIWLLGNDDANYSALITAFYDSSHVFSMQTRLNSSTMSEFLGIYSDGGGGNPRLALAPNGWKIGIGTTAPTDTVSIQSPSTYGTNYISISDRTTMTSGDSVAGGLKFIDYGGTAATIEFRHNSYFGNSPRALTFNISGTERMRISNSGSVTISAPLYVGSLPASSLYAINIKNTDMTDNSSSFDYISNGASGGGTSWNIVKDSIINLYNSAGGHYGTWGRQVYLEAGYWRFKGSVRLSSTNGSIHGSTSASNYQYNISFRFVISGGPDTGSLKWSTDALGDGTRVAFSSDASYKTAGLYTISFNTSGYDGVKQIYITDLELERVG